MSLSAVQLKAIAGLAQGKRLKDAAAAAGCTTRTINRWMLESKEFRDDLEAAKFHLYQSAIAQLSFAANSAIDTLVDISQDPKEKPGARVMAASTILRMLIAGIQGDSLDHAMSICRKYGYELKDAYPQGSEVVDEGLELSA
jgi:hypothetical protein